MYVAFGDSITEGYGVKKSFVSILSEKITNTYSALSLKTVNAGISGDTSRDGLVRLKHDVLSLCPDLVTVNFGVNDAFSGISAKQFADNLTEMAHRIVDSGCERTVLLSGEVIPEPWAERQVLPYWEAMREVADSAGCVYADAHGKWLGELMSGRPEGEIIIRGDMHPNEEGHRIIAQAVFEAIQDSGILENL